MAYNKTGSVCYNVTTDTHGYPWGYRNGVNNKVIHFDLGDNTAGSSRGACDPPEEMKVCKDAYGNSIALRGNHDTMVDNINPSSDPNKYPLQTYKDDAHKIMAFGLDTGTNTNINKFCIPMHQITKMAELMRDECLDNWDIIVLTHVPLFDGNSAKFGDCWPTSLNAKAPENADILRNLLAAYQYRSSYTLNGVKYNFAGKTGYVIGCFAGHVHNHIKGALAVETTPDNKRFLPYECFTTNGADEYPNLEGVDDQCRYNSGLYNPYEPYINVDFDTRKVNGTSYVNVPAESNDSRKFYHNEANCYYLNHASGKFKIQAASSARPKFFRPDDGKKTGVYIGYSSDICTYDTFGKNGGTDRYWPFGGVVQLKINNVSHDARVIWFDAEGRLRRYSNQENISNYHAVSSYKDIDDYESATVTFTANNVNWVFKGGLLESATPNFRSGTLYGKNGYTLEFNSSGVPYQIKLNGAVKTYPAGDNWINVTDIQIYDDTAKKTITITPQLGITGTFNSYSKINLARSTSSGTNQISAPEGLLIRVQGVSGSPMWLYDGKLTSLTDAQVL